MNREILFRGRRLDTGEWVEGELTRYSKAMSYITVDLIENMVYNVDSDTVGQFTGLLDKNGKRIFEGDMLGGECELVTPRGILTGEVVESLYVVEWDEIDASFVTRQYYESRNPLFYAERKPKGNLRICVKYFSYIGNIHDNPKMLKEATNEPD